MNLGVCRTSYTSGWILEIDLLQIYNSHFSTAEIPKFINGWGEKEAIPEHSVMSNPFRRENGIKKTNICV